MTTSTVPQLLQSIRACGLLEGAALKDAELLAEQTPEAGYFASELVRRQHLTPYQATELAHGRGAHLVLGTYVLLEPIGKGGMGEVFRARQTMLGRECALKIIRKDRLQNAEAVERFLREARAAAKLKDPNIVTIYDAGVTDGTHYLAMELLHGITLADKVKKDGPLSVGHACRYLRQAATGLQHAHEQGLVHRDIKPQNLFLDTASDQVKILDLGLARITEIASDGETAPGELTKEGEVMGTPDYMAPEQAVDTHSADHRADIYSLGCTIYFLISGRPPYPGGSLTEKLLAHQQKEPVALEQLCTGVPPRLVEVVRKAMAKQPADRYQTPAEFAAALVPFEYADNIVAAPFALSPARNETKIFAGHPTIAASSEDRPPKSKASNKAIWFVVIALVCVLACCPLMVVGVGLLGVGFFTIARPGAGHGIGHPVENVRQIPNGMAPNKHEDDRLLEPPRAPKEGPPDLEDPALKQILLGASTVGLMASPAHHGPMPPARAFFLEAPRKE